MSSSSSTRYTRRTLVKQGVGGRKLQWDPIKEEFIGDAEANRMRSRTMREPWKF